MADPEHVRIVEEGPSAINEWKQKNPERKFKLNGADLRGANLAQADLSQADLRGANLTQVDLTQADLRGANLTQADLTQADLSQANVSWANLREASLSDANLTRLKGAPNAHHLETVKLDSDARYFHTCDRTRLDRLLDWERLRIMGRLPLFGASYTALILIPLVFYVFALYNNNVDTMRNMVEEIIAWLGDITHQNPAIQENLLHGIREKAQELLSRRPIPSQSLLVLISTVLLAAGSTLYTFFCPSRIKEFSQAQWCDQLRHSLVHYWSLAWQYRWVRYICAACYALGGAGALWVILTKVWRAARFIIENSAMPFSLV
jgi:hypothetical protein